MFDRFWAVCGHALADDVGAAVPDDPWEQLEGAVEAVLRSWNTRRATTYREHHGIPHDFGTAVVVQAMVFGNLGRRLGPGVVFTRDPVTGHPALFGEYLDDSQGEDVVRRCTRPRSPRPPIASRGPRRPRTHCAERELAYRDVLDIEFTVERGTLCLLQVRSAKRTPEPRSASPPTFSSPRRPVPRAAAATDDLGRAGPSGASGPGSTPATWRWRGPAARLLTTGIGACPGQVSGTLVLDSDRAVKRRWPTETPR